MEEEEESEVLTHEITDISGNPLEAATEGVSTHGADETERGEARGPSEEEEERVREREEAKAKKKKKKRGSKGKKGRSRSRSDKKRHSLEEKHLARLRDKEDASLYLGKETERSAGIPEITTHIFSKTTGALGAVLGFGGHGSADKASSPRSITGTSSDGVKSHTPLGTADQHREGDDAEALTITTAKESKKYGHKRSRSDLRTVDINDVKGGGGEESEGGNTFLLSPEPHKKGRKRSVSFRHNSRTPPLPEAEGKASPPSRKRDKAKRFLRAKEDMFQARVRSPPPLCCRRRHTRHCT